MNRFKISENANPNYLATICRVGEVHPIEGADKICRTIVNGYDIVIGKDTQEGDIVIYVPVESAICEGFLSANNLFEIGEWERNSNHDEVGILLAQIDSLKKEGKHDEAEEIYKKAKSMVGYFNKRNRVRMVTLKGVASNGFIAGVDSLVKFIPELSDTNWEELVGTKFNYIDDIEFCWKYIPPIKEPNERNYQKNHNKLQRKLKRFNRLVPGQFNFHYDTIRLDGTNIHGVLHPEDIVTIDVKAHGTSIILSNILINKKLTKWEKIKKFFGLKVVTTEYGNVYSSRKVIKNQYINENCGDGYYHIDIWGSVNNVFSQYIPNGMTIYGEVVGYFDNVEKMIQKDHDYGCEVGHWKLMPYRITETDEFGNVKEWNVSEVDAWTRNLVKEHPELEEKILYLTILYHGKLVDLYPDIEIDENWYDNFLERIKNDKENFGMELKEPLCHLYEKEALAAKDAIEKAKKMKQSKKVISKLEKEYQKWESMRAPREGIVIRIDDDIKSEAFKIKTLAHEELEKKQHDNDEVDIEEIS